MVDDFISRKAGRSEVKYELSQLEPILSETYGVIAYQEQVMRIARDVAGFSLGEADILRKAMGKKNAEVMQAQRTRFVQGAVARGVNEKKATKLFELVEHFAGYGFPKAHSTTYALLAYQTAYLKANYARHFAAALLTTEAANTEKLALYIGECRERGIAVLPPDINESQLHFTVVPQGVRFGLTAIKGLGEGAIRAMLDVRERTGAITSLHQLCEELDLRLVNKRVLEALVKSGACDKLIPGGGVPVTLGRARLFAAVDSAIEHGARTQRDRDQGQADLFGGGEDNDGLTLVRLPEAAAWTEMELLAHEKDALGLYLSGHPLDRYADALRAFGARTVGDLVLAEVPLSADGSPGRLAIEDVHTGGIVAGFRPLKTKKGDRMGVFMLEDAQGAVEVVAFPETYARCASLIENGNLIAVRGKFERDDESARMQATELFPLDALRERLSKAVRIRLNGDCTRQKLEALWDLLSTNQGDRPVAIELEVDGGGRKIRVSADVMSQIRVRPTERLLTAVEQLCGVGSVTLR
jgi:DNA polymerase-3 subunit alpha